jgi:hypothetical protein
MRRACSETRAVAQDLSSTTTLRESETYIERFGAAKSLLRSIGKTCTRRDGERETKSLEAGHDFRQKRGATKTFFSGITPKSLCVG